MPPLQVRGAAVLTGCAISVPFRARRHRSATVHHGHSRRFTSASSTTTGAWQHEWWAAVATVRGAAPWSTISHRAMQTPCLGGRWTPWPTDGAPGGALLRLRDPCRQPRLPRPHRLDRCRLGCLPRQLQHVAWPHPGRPEPIANRSPVTSDAGVLLDLQRLVYRSARRSAGSFPPSGCTS